MLNIMHYCDYKERGLHPQAVRMNSFNITLLAIRLLIRRDASLCKGTNADVSRYRLSNKICDPLRPGTPDHGLIRQSSTQRC